MKTKRDFFLWPSVWSFKGVFHEDYPFLLLLLFLWGDDVLNLFGLFKGHDSLKLFGGKRMENIWKLRRYVDPCYVRDMNLYLKSLKLHHKIEEKPLYTCFTEYPFKYLSLQYGNGSNKTYLDDLSITSH